MEPYIFAAFCIVVLVLAMRKGFLADVPLATRSIWDDIRGGRFKKRRWHLHSLMICGGALLGWLGEHLKFELLINFIISLLLIGVIAFSVEWYQRHLGANRTKKEQFESHKDALFTDYCGLFGWIVTIAILRIFF